MKLISKSWLLFIWKQFLFWRLFDPRSQKRKKLKDFIGFLWLIFLFGLRIVGILSRVFFGLRSYWKSFRMKRLWKHSELRCLYRKIRERNCWGNICVNWDFKWEWICLCVYSCPNRVSISKVWSKGNWFVGLMGRFYRLVLL